MRSSRIARVANGLLRALGLRAHLLLVLGPGSWNPNTNALSINSKINGLNIITSSILFGKNLVTIIRCCSLYSPVKI